MFDHIEDPELLKLATEAGQAVARKYGKKNGHLWDAEELAAAAIVETLERRLKPWSTPGYVYKALYEKAELHYRKESHERFVSNAKLRYKVAEVRSLLLAAVWMSGRARDQRLFPYADKHGKVDWIEAKFTDTEEHKRKPHPVWVRWTDIQMSYQMLRKGEMDAIEAVCIRGAPRKGNKTWQRATDALTRHLNRRLNRMREEDNQNEGASQHFKGGPGVRKAMTNAKAQYLLGGQHENAQGYAEADPLWELQNRRVADDEALQAKRRKMNGLD